MVLFAAAAIVQSGTWTLACGGDIMLNGISPKTRAFDGVASLFKDATFAYANLEIPLTNATTRTRRKTAADIAARNQYVLKASPDFAPQLFAAGFDLLSLGNNHALDYGGAGLKEMQGLLNRFQIAHTGAGKHTAEAERLVVVSRNGIRLGMLSYLAFRTAGGLGACTPATQNTAGVAVLNFGGDVDNADRQRIAAVVSASKRQCDVLLVALHWGIERQTVPNAYQVSLGRAWIDAGADIVAGAHPHVLQGWEQYKTKPILYSLGNLVSPLPGETAILTLKFSGTRFQGIRFNGVTIRSGRALLKTGSAQASAEKRFTGLSQSIASRYPKK